MANSVISLNEVQQRVVSEVYGHVDRLTTRYVDADRANADQLSGETERGRVAVQIVMPCGTGKTEVVAAILNDDPEKYGITLSEGVPDRIGFEDALVLVVTPGSGGLDEQLTDRLRARLIDPKRVFHVRENKPMPESSLRGKVIVSSYDSLVKSRKLFNEDKTPKLDDNGEQEWEYINRASREDERANFWSVVKQARSQDIDVFVVIDEAHWGSGKSASSIGRFFDQIEDILGYVPLRIEATATPRSVSSIPSERLRRAEAKESDFTDRDILLRQDVVINENRNNLISDAYDVVADLKDRLNDAGTDVSDGLWHHVLMADLTLRKYRKIQKLARRHPHQPYNPLTLVCINNDVAKNAKGADNLGGADELTQLIDYYASKDITVDNGKLAIWLDDNPSSLTRQAKKDLADLQSEVEVLIFKQAVALGWDCPRAQFLLMVRKPSASSETFTPQLIGRIKRQPYGTVKGTDPREIDPLDKAYIYTAQAKLILSKEGLRKLERESGDETSGDGGDKPHGSVADQYSVWESLKPLKDHALRGERSNVPNEAFVNAASHVKISSLNYGADDAEADVISDAKLERKNDYEYADVVANAKDSFYSAGDPARDFGPKLTALYRGAGLNLSGRHSDNSKAVIRDKIQEFLKSDGQPHDERTVWATAIANLKNPEGDFADLLGVLMHAAKEGEKDHQNQWRRRGAEVFLPADGRKSDHAEIVKAYTKPLSTTHLYGHTMFTDTAKGPSTAELSFENEVLAGILDGVLVSWLRNSKVIDGDAKAYCVPFTPPNDSTLVRETFPDYVTILERTDGTNVFVAFEVKGNGNGHDGGPVDVIAAKAAEMARVTARTDNGWENTTAAVVYYNGVTWVVNEGPGTVPGKFATVPLTEWLKRQGVEVKR